MIFQTKQLFRLLPAVEAVLAVILKMVNDSIASLGGHIMMGVERG